MISSNSSESKNKTLQTQITRREERLADEKERLLARYSAMEAAIERANSILNALSQIDATQNSK